MAVRRVTIAFPVPDGDVYVWQMGCPLCLTEVGQLRGDGTDVSVHLVMWEVVHVSGVDRGGVPFYGLRDGAFLRGRTPLRHHTPRGSGILTVRGNSRACRFVDGLQEPIPGSLGHGGEVGNFLTEEQTDDGKWPSDTPYWQKSRFLSLPFDTTCPACHCRVRVDAADRPPVISSRA